MEGKWLEVKSDLSKKREGELKGDQIMTDKMSVWWQLKKSYNEGMVSYSKLQQLVPINVV